MNSKTLEKLLRIEIVLQLLTAVLSLLNTGKKAAFFHRVGSAAESGLS
jgi:hypothetical protein